MTTIVTPQSQCPAIVSRVCEYYITMYTDQFSGCHRRNEQSAPCVSAERMRDREREKMREREKDEREREGERREREREKR